MRSRFSRLPSASESDPLRVIQGRSSRNVIPSNKRVARSDGQRHKDDHAAGSVTRRRYNDDRTVTVDVMARRKSEVRAALESVLLIADAAEGFAELALSTRANELVLLRRDPLRQTGKSGKPLTWSQGEWVSRMARSDFWS